MVKRVIPASDQDGFTLLEVLMAMTIFSFFILAFTMSQGFNITSSARLAEDVQLHNLCERMMNEALLNPPKFTNVTDKEPISKNFEEDDLKHFKYTIQYKKMEIPDFAALVGEDPNAEKDTTPDRSNDALKKMVYQKLKKNMEEILWQVSVKVVNTENNYSYELSSWVTNPDAKMDTNFAF